MKSIADTFRSYEVLDAQGRHLNGTDKNGPCHSYGAVYEKLFDPTNRDCWASDPTRSSVRLMMEVGVADGSSLLAWRECFPNALCVGLDIHTASRLNAYEPPYMDRLEFHLGDACQQHNCWQAAAGREFDFICEDATHVLGDTLSILLYLWPFVRPGGIYVIEEFANVHSLRRNIQALFPYAEIIGTTGPTGSDEPLVVLRKPV